MPQITGRVVKPSGTAAGTGRVRVRFRLVDSSGNRVYQAWDTSANDRLIVDAEDFDLDNEGDYTVNLAPNTQIEPANTLWERVIMLHGKEGPTRSVIVPVGGGPYNEHDVLADPIAELPDPAPTNILDAAELTSASSALSVNVFALAPVPGLTVTVPDIPEPVLLRVRGPLKVIPSRTQSVTTTNGSAAITAASGLGIGDTGRTITGTGIGADTRVLSVQSATAATLSKNATGSGTNTATISGGLSTGALGIAAEPTPSIGEQHDLGYVTVHSASVAGTSTSTLHLPPHSPGDYYAVVYSFDTGTITVDASATQPARFEAVRYGAV